MYAHICLPTRPCFPVRQHYKDTMNVHCHKSVQPPPSPLRGACPITMKHSSHLARPLLASITTIAAYLQRIPQKPHKPPIIHGLAWIG